jgi:hypothetical protein
VTAFCVVLAFPKMKTTIGWKLYYGDGLVVSSLQSSWADAPSDNIQLLIVFYAETYKIHRDGQWHVENYVDRYHGYDYYWKLGDQFGNTQAREVPFGAEVKLGREVDQPEWRAIYNRALQDTKWA